MSGMKRFLEDVSIKHGYGGEINNHVMKLGQEELENKIDHAEHLVNLQCEQEADDEEYQGTDEGQD